MNSTEYLVNGSCFGHPEISYVPQLTAAGIVLTIIAGLGHVVIIPVLYYSPRDELTKALFIDVFVSGFLFSVFSLPMSLVQLRTSSETKSLPLCMITQGIQLFLMMVNANNLLLAFGIPLIILTNPFRQTFLQTKKGKFSLLTSVWIFSGLSTLVPSAIFTVESGSNSALCCGWYLYPKPFIYCIVYGALLTPSLAAVICSSKFVYIARQKVLQTTVVPVQDSGSDNKKFKMFTRWTKQLKWLCILVLHFLVSWVPGASVTLTSLHCVGCVNPELILYILNAQLVFGALVFVLTTLSFSDMRQTSRKLLIQCFQRVTN